MTNADKIRNMTDEELSEFICKIGDGAIFCNDCKPAKVDEWLSMDNSVKNTKCEFYYIERYTYREETPRCSGTKWCQECACEGDESQCDFFEWKTNMGGGEKE